MLRQEMDFLENVYKVTPMEEVNRTNGRCYVWPTWRNDWRSPLSNSPDMRSLLKDRIAARCVEDAGNALVLKEGGGALFAAASVAIALEKLDASNAGKSQSAVRVEDWNLAARAYLMRAHATLQIQQEKDMTGAVTGAPSLPNIPQATYVKVALDAVRSMGCAPGNFNADHLLWTTLLRIEEIPEKERHERAKEVAFRSVRVAHNHKDAQTLQQVAEAKAYLKKTHKIDKFPLNVF